MIERSCKLVGFLVLAQGLCLYAQEEKPAPKRAPARTAEQKAPAKPKDPPPAKPQSSPLKIDTTQGPTQATVEMVLNEMVKNIAKRYNLNEEQKKKTDEIMKRDVNKFLKDHEAEVWPIIRDLMSNGFQPPSNPEDVKRIGKAIQPLVKKAQKAILDGNEEWGRFLTPEQKAVHDYDIRAMEKQFVEVEKTVDAWVEGKATGGLFPEQSFEGSPKTPPKPPEGMLPKPPPLPEPEVEIFVKESVFDTYVEDFIKQYELDPAQIDAARSILDEFKQKAGNFKESNRAELTRIAHEQKEATDAKDREAMAKAESERKKLLEPVYALFVEMDERLKALLTSSQRERFGTKEADAAQKRDTIINPPTVNAAPSSPAQKSAPPPPPPERAANNKSKTNNNSPPAPKPQPPATTP